MQARYVVSHPWYGWQVIDNQGCVRSQRRTRHEAIRVARGQLMGDGGGELYIYSTRGTVQHKTTIAPE